MASRPDCEDDAGRQDAYQAPHMAGGSGLVPAFTGGQMPGWQGEQWMHPGAALAGWEVPSGWEAASSAGYAIPYGMPPQQQQLLQLQPQLQTQTRGGVIFLCDSQTEDECLQRGLFGMPASQTQIVRQIAPEATLLFLFNVRTRLMSGVFRATSWPQLNLEPSAWGEGSAGGSRYPLQVRVRLETEAVLQVGEDRLRHLLEYRGSHNRFDMHVSKAHADAIALIFSQFGQRRPATAPALGLVGQSIQRLGGVASRPAGGPSAEGASAGSGSGERQWKNGVIFICDGSTEQECISRRLLGLPKSQTSLLSKMGDSSFLFLFNVRSRQLLGVLQPDGPAGMDLEPSAWGGGRFPVQVRFRPASPSGQILSLPEAALGDVLRYRNATARFDLLLRAKALDKLVGLFAQYGVPISTAGAAPMGAPMPPPPQYGMPPPPPHELPQYGMPPMPPPMPQPQPPQQLPPLPPLPPLPTPLPQPTPLPPADDPHPRAKDAEGEGERGPRSSGGGESFGQPSGEATSHQLQSMLGSLSLADQPPG